MRYFVWQSPSRSLWKVPRVWQLRRLLSSNTRRSDKRVWSLYRIMNGSMMSLGTQVGRYLEEKRHRYGITYSTIQLKGQGFITERIGLLKCVKSGGEIPLRWQRYWTSCTQLKGWFLPMILSTPYFTFFLGSVPRRTPDFKLLFSCAPTKFTLHYTRQTTITQNRERTAVYFPSLASISSSYSPAVRIQRKTSQVFTASWEGSVDMAARELKELKDCVCSVPEG